MALSAERLSKGTVSGISLYGSWLERMAIRWPVKSRELSLCAARPPS